MKDTYPHIAYLLLSQRKVVITGFGTFLLTHRSATFHKGNSSFTPSKNIISFEEDSSVDCQNLPASISRKLKIDVSVAEQMVRKFVDEIKGNLEKNRYCRLPSLGYLLLDSSDNIVFQDTFTREG